MKIRADFVTNSSSSSFVVFEIYSDTLASLLLEYKETLFKPYMEDNEDFCIREFILDEHHVEFRDDEGGYYQPPRNKKALLDCFAEFLLGEADLLSDCYYDSEEDLEEIDFYALTEELISKLREKRDQILNDVSRVEWNQTDFGYGGDSDPFYYDDFTDEERQVYMQMLAEELKKPVEEVTEKEFNDWSCNFPTESTSRYVYDKNKNIETYEAEKILNYLD